MSTKRVRYFGFFMVFMLLLFGISSKYFGLDQYFYDLGAVLLTQLEDTDDTARDLTPANFSVTNNQDVPPAPWSAITVDNSKRVSVNGRKMFFSGQPWPSKILVGRVNILSGKIKLNLGTARIRWQTYKLASVSPREVVFEGSGIIIGGSNTTSVPLSWKTRIEFDGAMFIEFRIDPISSSPLILSQAKLRIPMRQQLYQDELKYLL